MIMVSTCGRRKGFPVATNHARAAPNLKLRWRRGEHLRNRPAALMRGLAAAAADVATAVPVRAAVFVVAEAGEQAGLGDIFHVDHAAEITPRQGGSEALHGSERLDEGRVALCVKAHDDRATRRKARALPSS